MEKYFNSYKKDPAGFDTHDAGFSVLIPILWKKNMPVMLAAQ